MVRKRPIGVMILGVGLVLYALLAFTSCFDKLIIQKYLDMVFDGPVIQI